MPGNFKGTTVTYSFPVAGIDLTRAFSAPRPRQILPSTVSTTTFQGQPVVQGIDVTGQQNPQYWGRGTPLGINVRGFEPIQNRKRGGSRCGLSQYIPAQLPGGTYIIQGLNYSVDTQPMQTNSAGRVVTLVAVQKGNVYWALSGDTSWSVPVNVTNPTGASPAIAAVPPLAFSGIVRSTVCNQNVYFADGKNWVYFNPSANTVNTWVPGTVDLLGNPITSVLPVDADGNLPRLITTWRNRILVSGLLDDPQTIFASAVGDPNDWDYSPLSTTPTQAFALDSSSPAGYVGDVVTCIIPYTNDVAVIGGDHSIYLINGDPMNGGQVDFVTGSVGMAFGTPWCMDPYGNIYFVSNKTGIYMFNPQPGNVPQRISQNIEQLLQNIDTGLNTINMIWDDRFQGLHIFITPTGQVQSYAVTDGNVPQVPVTHLFYEQRTGAWWQDQFANPNHNPLCCTTFDGNAPGDRVALIGSWDGYVRSIDPFATMDDGWPIASKVLIGPILTGNMGELILHDLQGVLGETSGEVQYDILTGRTAEEAIGSESVMTGTLNESRNPSEYVRVAGFAIYIQLSSTNEWSMEQIRCKIDGELGKVTQRSQYI
jgi:hypothetical protein